MRLPEFCAEGQRTHVLLLSYTLDPIFFESVVLRRLEIGGAQRVLVLADAHEALARTAEAAADLRQIGRSWALGAVRVKGSFHPKLIARFSKKDAAVAVLSGNITPSGWGRNLEVGSHWLVGPGHGDQGAWLAGLLDTCAEWSLGTTQSAILDEIRSFPWLKAPRPAVGPRSAVLASGGATLFAEIRRRWTGRRFDRARISTGSTDADGEFVRQLVSAFGLKKVEVYVDSDRHSFVANRVVGLPLTLWSPPSERPLHAKVVWLTGPDGDAAAWGSPNCSRSAWLLPAVQGGNVELAVLDDKPNVAALRHLFASLKGGPKLQALDKELPSRPEAEQYNPLDVTEVNVDGVGRWVVHTLKSLGRTLEAPLLRISTGNREIGKVSLSAQGEGFVGIAPELRGHSAMFARLCGFIAGKPVESSPIPVNQSALLLRGHIDPDKARRLGQLTSDKTSFAERDAVLQDLFDLAWSEYDDTGNVAASGTRIRREADPKKDDGEVAPLNPLELVYHAASGNRPIPSGRHGRSSIDVLSIFERLIWLGSDPGMRDAHETDRENADWEDEPPDELPNATGQGGRAATADADGSRSASARDQLAEDAETAASIRLRLGEWIHWLRGETVLREKDPPAVAYRCALFVLGISRATRKAKWIPARDATDFAVQTAQCFLRIGKTSGLLADMRDQCSEGPLLESFQTHLASGRLLAAFVSAFTADDPECLAEAVERGSMLDRLRADPTFVTRFDPDGLEALCANSPDPAAQIERLSRAPAIAEAAAELDGLMQFQRLDLRRRIGRNGTQMTPDLFWSEAEGWVPDRTHRNVNTPCIGWKAASQNSVVLRAAEAVMSACVGSACAEGRPADSGRAVHKIVDGSSVEVS